jgi:uncharacterized protein
VSFLRKALFASLLLALPGSASAAPSFDCTKAASVVEKAICADAKLSAADQKLAVTYQSALSRIPTDGQAQFRQSQRQWLSFVHTVCDMEALPKNLRFVTTSECIANAYDERQGQLDATVLMQKSSRKFHYLALFKARKSSDQGDKTGSHPGFVTLMISYPVLDNPQSTSDTLLNAKLSDMAKHELAMFAPNDDTDIYLDIEASGIFAAFTSIEIADSQYGHGAAHPLGGVSWFHWLARDGRELMAQDIFDDNTAWKNFVSEACFQAVKHFGKISSAEGVKDTATKPSAWSFDKKGLSIQFNPYEVASYADGAPVVTIPWSKLKPYLAKDAPALLEGIL